jgi:hypothetical protein
MEDGSLIVDLKNSSMRVLCAENEPTESFSFFCSGSLAGVRLYLASTPAGRQEVSTLAGPASTMKGREYSPYLNL